MKLKAALKEIDQKGDHTKEYNLTMNGKKITLEEESNVSAKIWTKPQQEYLDKKFGEVNNRLDNLESDVAELKKDMVDVKSDLKLIINHLGIKKAA